MNKSTNEEVYKQIATSIIKKQIEIIGDFIALKKARKVDNLLISDDGEALNIGNTPVPTLEKLIQEYISLSGNAAIAFSKEAIKDILSNYPSLELPLSLK